MKIVAERNSLLAAACLASGALPRRAGKDELVDNFLLVAAEGDRLDLSGTDRAMSLQVQVPGVEVRRPGIALVDGRTLQAILSSLTESQVTIEARLAEAEDEDGDEKQPVSAAKWLCWVKAGKARFTVGCADSAGYPATPGWDDASGCQEITAGVLGELVHRTVFAAAEETALYSMAGVLWEFEDAQARLVGCDGLRLALADGEAVAWDVQPSRAGQVVVPTRALRLLARCCRENLGAVVKVCLRDGEAMFKTDRVLLASRLVEGRFPDYRAALPTAPGVNVVLNVGAFARAVRQAAVMADGGRLTMRFSQDRVTLSARGASGRCTVEASLKQPVEGSLTVGVVPGDVLDVLGVLPSEADITLDLTPAAKPSVAVESPILCRCGADFTALLMPTG